MTACADLIGAYLRHSNDEFHCRVVGDNRVAIKLPFMYADGDALEVHVELDGRRVVVSDYGASAGRMLARGYDIERPYTLKRLREAVRPWGLRLSGDAIEVTGDLDQVGELLHRFPGAMLDAEHATGTKSADVSERFEDRVVEQFARNRVPVERRPPVQGRSGTEYRPTARLVEAQQPVYVQAIRHEHTSPYQVDHAFRMFTDIKRREDDNLRLVVINNRPDDWAAGELRMLSEVAVVGSWTAQERLLDWATRPRDLGDSPLLFDTQMTI